MKIYFYLQDGSEVVRSTIAGELVSRYGEGLQKETQRLDTLVNSVEFFYTEWTGSSAGKVSTKVKDCNCKWLRELITRKRAEGAVC